MHSIITKADIPAVALRLAPSLGILGDMLTRHQHKGVKWIDLENPTTQETSEVVQEFGIDPVVARELMLPSIKSRVDNHDQFLYLILHFPALRHSHKTKEQEVDFVVSRDFIITSRYDTVDPLHKFSKIFDVHSVLEKDDLGEHAGHLLYHMLKRLYNAVEHEIDFVRTELSQIEAKVFDGHEREMVEAISRAGRDLLNLRQSIEPHRDILHQFEEQAPVFFGPQYAPSVRMLMNEYYRVHNHIMRETENLHELRATNNSLVETKQNDVIQRLTAGALITFPLALITSVLGLNVPGNPILQHPNAFWVITCIVAVGAGSLAYYFGKKGWL